MIANGSGADALVECIASSLFEWGARHRHVIHSDRSGGVRAPADVARFLRIDIQMIGKSRVIVDLPERECSALLDPPVVRSARLDAAGPASGMLRVAITWLREPKDRLQQPLHCAARFVPSQGTKDLRLPTPIFGAAHLIGRGSVGRELELEPSDLVCITEAPIVDPGEDQ